MALAPEVKDIFYPLRIPVLPVEQPLGRYFVGVVPAEVLLDVCFSDFLFATLDRAANSYSLDGTQRSTQPKRLDEIASYIDRDDAAFPNSIILAANYRQEDGQLEGDDEDGSAHQQARRWQIEQGTEEGVYWLVIPTADKLAAIIDGQHRLFAFTKATRERRHMNLICSIFLDLPRPFQAHLFATINSTQKAVNRSLTYELFGYNIDEESEEYWSPDKLAVFLARKLSLDMESPLRGKVLIAPMKDSAIKEIGKSAPWKVSMAVVVDGILRLISTNPKKDANSLRDGNRKERKAIATERKDSSPLRVLYLSCQDKVLYTLTLNFLTACDDVFWKDAGPDSYIKKTIGVQALFDVLRVLAPKAISRKDLRVELFVSWLQPAREISFSETRFKNPSGSGRTLIRREIEDAIATQIESS